MSTDKIHKAGITSLLNSYVIREGTTLEEAVKRLKQEHASNLHDLIEQVAEEIRLKQESHVKINSAITGVRGERVAAWYTEQSDDVYWPTYNKALEEKKFSAKSINDLDRSTSKILNSTQKPFAETVDTRGLVVGYVQSGKTANYIGLIAKAADAGYKLIVVLTGTKEALRKQTQDRIDKDLLSKNEDKWYVMTKSRDFRKRQEQKPHAMMSANIPSICVVKKNQAILRNLVDWLTKEDGHTQENPRLVPEIIRKKCPLLIIDDECDEASINVSRNEEQSRIYQRLMALISAMPRAAYIGYTATPFANVLIDPSSFQGQNLYPKDFIYHLTKPEKYFGPEDIFGRDRISSDDEDADLGGKNMFRVVPIRSVNPRRDVSDVERLRPVQQNHAPTFEPKPTYSLFRACYFFWISTAAKIARLGDATHTTMFIHTHVRAIIHDKTCRLVTRFYDLVKEKILNNDPKIILRLRKIWKEESNKVPREEDEREILFEEIQPLLKDVIERTEIIQRNILPGNRGQLGYKNELNEDVNPGKIYILIGGNILSRGLTLEGLTVSYFLRTASTYDTLLQMGRWFGFRPGYSDFPRIWMTRSLERNFYRLALVEQEIREDIDLYEDLGLTPLQWGVRIRQLPSMLVTSRLKMRDAVQNKITFDRRRPELRYFPVEKKDWLINNLTKFKNLISDNFEKFHQPSSSNSVIIFRQIAHEKIIGFIDDFQFHEEEKSVVKGTLLKYAKLLFEKKLIKDWNIAIIARKNNILGDGTDLGTIKINEHLLINCINRAKLGSNCNPAHLKTVSSKDDVIKDIWSEDSEGENINYNNHIDLFLSRNKFLDKDNRHIDDKKFLGTRHYFDMRRELIPETGLLVFYPISKHSKYTAANNNPTGLKTTDYEPLEAKEHVISFMTIFPPAKDEVLGADIRANYVSANLPDIDDDGETEQDQYDEGEDDDTE